MTAHLRALVTTRVVASVAARAADLVSMTAGTVGKVKPPELETARRARALSISAGRISESSVLTAPTTLQSLLVLA
jgi:hypothetical protein